MAIEDVLMLDKDFVEWTDTVMQRRYDNGGRRHRAKYLTRYFSEGSIYTLDNLRDILVESRMRFSSRTEFNDPFDSHCEYSPPANAIEAHEYFRLLALRQGETQERARELADNQIARGDWLPQLNSAQRRVVDRTGIICFAEKPDSMLMWSHYGDNHRGVAVVFRDIREVDAFLYSSPVCYGREFPRFKFAAASNLESVLRALLYKSEEWHYEYEWRTVKIEGAGTYQMLRNDVVCGVIFGCKARPDFIGDVCDLIRERDLAELPPVRIDKMQLSENLFELEPVEMALPTQAS